MQISQEELKKLIDDAAESGARRALKGLGFNVDDPEKAGEAQRDITELRDLLRTWRDIRHQAISTATKLTTGLIILGLVVYIGGKSKLAEMLTKLIFG